MGDDYDLDRLSVLVNQRMTMREDVAARMQLVGSIPLDRLRELVEADREGRCVVLPCKIDDEVYVNIMGKTLPSTVVSVSWITETPTFKAMHGVQLCFIFKSEDVGKNRIQVPSSAPKRALVTAMVTGAFFCVATD